MSVDAGTKISAGMARREAMLEPDEVTAMLRLKKLGWGTRRIARELGCSRTTVQRYIEAGGWRAFRRPAKAGRLSEHAVWLRERFFRHGGNADVVRQDLARELGVEVSLRTVERAVSGYRQQLAAEARATGVIFTASRSIWAAPTSWSACWPPRPFGAIAACRPS